MSFTYNVEGLTSDKIAQIRLATGQTTSSSPIQDVEIQHLLNLSNGNVTSASIKVMDSLIAQASNYVDGETGQQQESRSQALKQYQRLRDDIKTSSVIPTYAGIKGIYEEERRELQDDATIYNSGLHSTTKYPWESLFPDTCLPTLPEDSCPED